MPVTNQQIADIFREVAEILGISGANPFRIRAYQQASELISHYPQKLSDMVEAKEDLSKLPGIGVDLAQKIAEIVGSGKLTMLEKLEKKIPPETLQLLHIPSLGPKRVQRLYQELKIKNLSDLEAAIIKKKLRTLAGFGEKLEAKILAEIQRTHGTEKRVLWIHAQQDAEPLVDYLKQGKNVDQVTIAGSYRRHRESVGDLDILITSDSAHEVMNRLVQYDNVAKILAQGSTRATVILHSGLQVDIRVVTEESYGAALLYFTGSKSHNIALRKLAQAQGIKINEYGVFKNSKQLAGQSEEEIYQLLNMDYIPPELREGKGEIQAALDKKIPKLISLQDLQGDLHVHSEASDGSASLEAMAEAAKTRGLKYIAITDHSARMGITHGLNTKRLAQQMDAIDRLNGKLQGIHILKGIEVDILPDGSLDLPDSMLKELDLTVCSIHSHFDLPIKKQTERVLRAMDNPYFKIFGHPSARLIGQRRPCQLDMEQLMKAAVQRGCTFEINAQPERLDLDENYGKLAKELKLKLVISTDAHAPDQFRYLALGIAQARRAWLEKNNILNTRSLKTFLKMIARN